MASKKGGLGAQKVSSKSFSELEKKAQAVDKLREQEEATVASKKNAQPEESMCVLLLSFFVILIVLVPVLLSVHLIYSPQCSVLETGLQRSRAAEENRGAKVEGIRWEEERAS